MAIWFSYPNQLVSRDAVWTPVPAGTGQLWDDVDDPYNAPDDSLTYIWANAAGAVEHARFWGSIPQNVLQINSVSVTIRFEGDYHGTSFTLSVYGLLNNGSTDQVLTAFTNSLGAGGQPWTTATVKWTTNPFTSAAWQPNDLLSLAAFGVAYEITPSGTGAQVDVTQCYMSVDYTPSPLGLPQPQLIAGRLLRLFRRPVPKYSVSLPWKFAGLEPGHIVQVKSPFIPSPSGIGTVGPEPWRGQPLLVIGVEHDLDNLAVKATLVDIRYQRYLCNIWDSMLTDQPLSVQRDGTVGLDAGNARNMARLSSCLSEDPSVALTGGVLLVPVSLNQEKITPQGEAFESAGSNQLWNSTFSSLTGLTRVGTTGTITVDATDLIAATSTTPASLKLLGPATPGATDYGESWVTASTRPANSPFYFSVYYKNATGGQLYFWLQRAVDSKYWNASTNTWQASIAYNPLPVSTTAVRYKSPIGNLGGTATNFTFAIVGAGTGSGVTAAQASQLDRVYSAQIGLARWVDSSTIQNLATTDSPATSVGDNFTYTDFVGGHGERSWPVDCGYCFMEIIPHFNSADLLSTDVKTFAGPYIDANDSDLLYYTNGQLCFTRMIGGVSYTATLTMTLTRGVPAYVACRWVGPNGENGLTPYLLSVFGNGVRGTDAVAPGLLLTPASQLLGVGKANAANQADCDIAQFETGHEVPWDAQIADMP